MANVEESDEEEEDEEMAKEGEKVLVDEDF